jgi:glycosyltransferase involved in cell wall biosynthesis
MPTYNAAQYIDKAIQSVIDQTFTDWELLIFDDGSTDNTEDIVAPFLNDLRIQYIKQENLGQPKTRNKGVRMSRGNLIALLDSDDIWLKNKLEKQVEIFEKYPDVGVCGTSTYQINPEGKIWGTHIRKEFYGKATSYLFTGHVSIGMSTSITRKEVYDTIGYFDEGYLPFSMDYDFWLRASIPFNFYVIEEPLVQYRSGHTSISSQGKTKRRDLVMNIVVPRFLKEYGGSKYVKWYHVWMLRSDCYFIKACEKTTWGPKTYWLFRSILCNPMNRDAVGALAGQILPRWCVSLLKKVLRR